MISYIGDNDPVVLVEKNIHGAWVIYGTLGVKQYYGYTKREAVQLYREEAERCCTM